MAGAHVERSSADDGPMKSIRFAVLVLLVLMAAVACSTNHGERGTPEAVAGTGSTGDNGSGDGPRDAKSITYEVEFGDHDKGGEADVSYTDQDGSQRQVHVTLPWTSDVVLVKSDATYRLSVETPTNRDDYLSCGVHTDNGWISGPSSKGGHCGYSFPDDAGT